MRIEENGVSAGQSSRLPSDLVRSLGPFEKILKPVGTQRAVSDRRSTILVDHVGAGSKPAQWQAGRLPHLSSIYFFRFIQHQSIQRR